MMSKERLEELHKFYISGTLSVEELIEEVVELEQINEVLINQIKRCYEAKRQIEEKYEYFQDVPSSVSTGLSMAIEILDKALEGDEE